MRRYLTIIQDLRGYPPPGDNAPLGGLEQPVLHQVVKADEHEAEVQRLRESLRLIRDLEGTLDDARDIADGALASVKVASDEGRQP
jgi:hypothetical protein